MRRAFWLSLLLCPLSPAFSSEHSAPARQPTELERLEQVFERAQDAKQRGRLAPERYDEFLVQFRLSLEKAWSLSPRTPPETSAYARILARLGDSGQALAVLAPAMKQDPGNADLGLTFGEVAFERKDFPAALAQADAVLARDLGNKRALALKRLSEGRSSGTAASGPSPLDLSLDEPVSELDDPRIVEAGRRASARRNATHFLDQSMRRLKIEDPREALRYLALAEASDPGLADIPMQQGFAYMGLKEPGQAQPRFARAEEMWAAKGDGQAALARTMRERAAAQLAEPPQGATSRSQEEAAPRGLDRWINHHPWGVGAQWALGTRKDGWTWTDGSPMTEGLKTHEGIERARKEARAKLVLACLPSKPSLPPPGDAAYRLGKEPWYKHGWIYFTDALIITTGGFLGGNIEARWHGSYNGAWHVTGMDCCRGEADISFVIEDELHLDSLGRIPFIGYSGRSSAQSWLAKPGLPLPGTLFNNNPFGKDGPFGTRRKLLKWHETIMFDGGRRCSN